VPIGDYIRRGGQRAQCGVVTLGTHADDLVMGAMGLAAPNRYPRRERGIQLGQRAETPPGQDVITHDVHLAFDPAFGPHRRLHPIPMIGIAGCG
jgi:hypothetical protein